MGLKILIKKLKKKGNMERPSRALFHYNNHHYSRMIYGPQ